jgi:hypothetical protein
MNDVCVASKDANDVLGSLDSRESMIGGDENRSDFGSNPMIVVVRRRNQPDAKPEHVRASDVAL